MTLTFGLIACSDPRALPLPFAVGGGVAPFGEVEAAVRSPKSRAILDPVPYQEALDALAFSYQVHGLHDKAVVAAETLLASVRRFGYLPRAIPLSEAQLRLGSILAGTSGGNDRGLELLMAAKKTFDESSLRHPGEMDENYQSLLSSLRIALRMAGRGEEADAVEAELLLMSSGPDASSRLDEGWKLFRTSNYEGSLLLGHQALSLALEKNSFQVQGAAQILMARSLEGLGETDTAIFWARASLENVQARRMRLRARDNRDAFVKRNRGPYTLLARLLNTQGRFLESEQVLTLLKADELEALGVRRAATGSVPPGDARETKLAAENLKRTLDILKVSSELETLGDRRREAKQFSSIDAVRHAELTALSQGWRKLYLEFLAETRIPAVDPNAVRVPVAAPMNLQLAASRGDRTVAIRYILDSDRLDITFYTRHAALPQRILVSTKNLELQINAWRRAVQDGDPLIAEYSKPLYEALIAPVQALLKASEAQTVVLALDGVLRSISFAALQGENKKFLVEQYSFALHYDPKPALGIPASPRAVWRIAGLGVTEGHRVSVGGQGLVFNPLPHAKVELESLQRLGLSRAGDTSLDAAFTPQRFLEVLRPPYNVIHVASHYRFAKGREDLSVLLLGSGVLSLASLASYDYTGFELITFSACGSGLSENADNPVAIEGLGGAVLQAGAMSAMVTLWDISDQATPKLMEDFYRATIGGTMTRAAALREAQLQVLRNRVSTEQEKHPRAWGAFVLMGEWR